MASEGVIRIYPSIVKMPNVHPVCDVFNARMHRISVWDCKIHCEIEGEGSPMVLINGGPGGAHKYFHP
jgi:proline iminopeptidase